MTVTLVGMGFGGAALLGSGIALQGLPHLSLANWGIVLWLAVVNSAFAFTLWNHTQRTLAAVESSILNNTMLFQVGLMAWLVLGEALSLRQMGGMALAGVGVLLVQLRRRTHSAA